MFGIQLWVIVAAVLSLGIVFFAMFRLRTRAWTYRILLSLGLLALIWGVMPILGGGKMSPYLVVGAIAAFGFLVLADSTSEGSQW